MGRKNILALGIVLVLFFAVNSYAQTIQRDQLLGVNEKLAQYNVKQATAAAAAFSLRDYYKSIGLPDIEIRYGQIGVLIDETIQDSSSIQIDIARNLDNYENVRVSVRSKLLELRNTHDLVQKRLNETIQKVASVRPTIQSPALLTEQDANILATGSYQSQATLHYSNAATQLSRAVTPDEIKGGQLPSIIAGLPSGGTTIVEFNQTLQEQPQPVPTDIIPECTLRLQYVVNAVAGSETIQSSSLLALGGSFKTALPLCMFKINGTYFYNIDPAKKTDNSALYCTLPPGLSGQAEVWIVGKGCRESGHVGFSILPSQTAASGGAVP